ncbi:MAG: multidrug ABC transporter permease [Alphaproteobacteria bacterium CG_4_9_14_3_um_filter_47_13]|nr:MAG: multidrug ABC transporter permease [Alphaproteobacteria bacterium CG_4_9_14_3_um_filter_47_13]
MSDMQVIPQAPQPRKIKGLNKRGLITLIGKEVGRYLSVYTQTIVAPVITTLLFYAVFFLALGGMTQTIGDISYMEFLAPGLIMMAMAQNSFANTSSSIVISKVQGNIVDVLMPPLSATELFIGYVTGGILRGLMVGFATGLAVSLFISLSLFSVFYIVLFAILGTMMMSSLGLAGGIWSQKFDHIAAVTNFIITPMTFLSGTFYSIGRLPELWQTVAHYNPFFHMIDGIRYGFTGHADGNTLAGIFLLVIINLILACLCLWMLRTGYKIKS